MNEAVIEKIDSYIQALAEQIGVASEYVFTMLVKQQQLYGYLITFICFLTLLLFFFLCFAMIRIRTKGSLQHSDKYQVWKQLYNSQFVYEGFDWFIFILVSIIVLVGFVFSLISGPLRIFNPEYYALKEILDVIKGQ